MFYDISANQTQRKQATRRPPDVSRMQTADGTVCVCRLQLSVVLFPRVPGRNASLTLVLIFENSMMNFVYRLCRSKIGTSTPKNAAAEETTLKPKSFILLHSTIPLRSTPRNCFQNYRKTSDLIRCSKRYKPRTMNEKYHFNYHFAHVSKFVERPTLLLVSCS